MLLYHASQHRYLKLLKPQKTLGLNKYIGDYVFATSDKIMAIMYLVPHGFPALMYPAKPNANLVICATAEDFKAQDRGGAIYKLSSQSFKRTPQEGMSDFEMVSEETVRPVAKTMYKSTLKTFAMENIAIRFVDEATFKKLINNPRQSEIIEQITQYHDK